MTITPAQAIDYAVFAINTVLEPDASTDADVAALTANADATLDTLAGLRALANDGTLEDLDLRGAAEELRLCHEETGIDVRGWEPVRTLVEAYTGPLEDYDRSPLAPAPEPRSYLLGLPVLLEVHPSGRIIARVDLADASAGILDAEDDNPDADRVRDAAAVDQAVVDRTVGAIALRPRVGR